MFRNLFSFLWLSAAFTLSAQPVLVEGIAAVVGSQVILDSDIELQKQALAQEGHQVTSCDLVHSQMVEKLLIHHAAIDSVVVGEAEVDDAINRRIAQLVQQIGSEERLQAYYKKSILEIKEDLRPLMHDQLTAQRMQSTITSNVVITPLEVRDVVLAMPEDSLPLIGTELVLSQITMVPEVSEEAVQEAIDKLNQLRDRILGGSSFSTMAILYSEDPGSNKSGGAYSGIKRGQFVKEFEAVAFNLRPGEVSKPFKTEYGYHIVQLQAKRGEELDLRHILIKPKVSQADLDSARKKLDEVRELIVSDSLTFAEAAEIYSSDEETRLNGGTLLNPMTGDLKWSADNLDRSLFYAVDGLDAGEMSQVKLHREQDGTEIFRIVKLDERTAPHRANLDQDFNMLKQYVENVRRQEFVEQWIEDKKDHTYLHVNPKYEGCGL